MHHRRICFAFVGLIALAISACGSDSSSSDYGKAGDPAEAGRTVNVQILPAKRYDPCSVGVKAGETLTFKVTNTTSELHELVIGDEKVQEAHEKLMSSMGTDSMKVADTPNIIDLDPGQTKSLTWTFPTKQGAVVIYGSHAPGDFAGGLRGTITVGAAAACQAAAGAAATTGAEGAATTVAGTPTTVAGTTATTAAGSATTVAEMPGMGSTTGP